MSVANPGRLLAVARAFRAALLREERGAAVEMLQAYQWTWARIKQNLEMLTAQYQAEIDAGKEPNIDLARALRRATELQEIVLQQMRIFGDMAGPTVANQQRKAVELAGQHAAVLTKMALGPGPDGMAVRFNEVPTEALKDLIGFTANGSPLRELFDKLGTDASEAARRVLVTGFATGEGARKIAKRMRAEMGMTLDRALRISRTETLRSYREATRRDFKENPQVVKGWIWSAALDLRTCPMCWAMHGTKHTVNETLDDHPNGRCHPGWVLASGPAAVAASTRYYVGQLVTIRTARGTELSFTPNHPILTPGGWVAGGLLQEGDYVVCGSFGENAAAAIDKDDYHAPALIKEIVESFRVVLAKVPCAAEDFHGDGEGSDVYVVRSDSLLRDGGDSTGFEPVFEHDLCRGNVTQPGLSCGGDLATMFKGLTGSPGGLLGDGDTAMMLLKRRLSGKQAVGFGLVSELNAGFAEPPANGSARGVESSGESVLRFAGKIETGDLIDGQVVSGGMRDEQSLARQPISGRAVTEQTTALEFGNQPCTRSMESVCRDIAAFAGNIGIDRILEVRVRAFAGHVYSLQTNQGWYIASDSIAHYDGAHNSQGIIAHNCAMVSITPTWAELGFPGVPESRGEVETGASRFARLGAEQQREILGPAAYEAYRDGAVRLEDFVGRKSDDDWGSMRYARSLSGMLGQEESMRYRAMARGGE